ncbi:MFS transporter [Streptomyces sp. NPDC005279]|uniref:MFS transporter n=1 Tax=Streptomyces sp. NPDC005279 TaxID=3364712 RepID=UPI0036919775
MLGAATAGATAVWQVVLRAAAWTARGLRVPARNALLADIVPAKAYGRAYGFERMMDNLGAIFGPLLALGLLAWLGVTWAIGLSVIPGLLAAAAIIYAIRQTPRPTSRDKVPLKIRIRPVLTGDLGRLMGAVAAFEVGNVAATLLILRASELLAPEHGTKTATTIALGLYTAYNVAATIASIPAGRMSDRLGARGPVLVLTGGVAAFALAYGLFSVNSPVIAFLAIPFLLAGVGIGAVETAQHSAVAALAPKDRRGSAFGMLATVQSLGNLAASTVAGVLWTTLSPTAAFTYLTAWMLFALFGLLVAARRRGH